jgi:hypothetical protein
VDIVDAILKRTAELAQVQATLEREAGAWESRILESRLFQDCAEGEMWCETPSTAKRTLLCRDRPRLIQVLARARVEHQYLTGLADKTPQAVRAAAFGALDLLSQVLSLSRHRPSRAPVSAPAAYSTDSCHPVHRKVGSWPLYVMSRRSTPACHTAVVRIMSEAAPAAAAVRCRLDHTSGVSTF